MNKKRGRQKKRQTLMLILRARGKMLGRRVFAPGHTGAILSLRPEA